MQVLENPELWKIHTDLVHCILAVYDNDAKKAANAIKKLYGILNACTHNYFDDQLITTILFQESGFREIVNYMY